MTVFASSLGGRFSGALESTYLTQFFRLLLLDLHEKTSAKKIEIKTMKIDFRKCWNPKSLFTKTEKPVPRPAGREQVIDWFKTTQRPKKIGFNSEGNAHEWFHGKSFFEVFIVD